jgi:hypothetical protein
VLVSAFLVGTFRGGPHMRSLISIDYFSTKPGSIKTNPTLVVEVSMLR